MARGAFWTIIVDDQPTAFRAAVREDLLPTLKQLQRQHPGAVIKWFQRGRLWETPGEAMDAAKPPRRGADWRPGGTHKDPRAQYKVPRDVKRARWAAQAAEGRGPWVKDSANAERRTPNAERGPATGNRQRTTGATRDDHRRPASPKPTDGGGQRATGGARPATGAARGDRGKTFKPAWKPKGGRPEDAERRTPNAGRRPAAGNRQEATGATRDDRRRPASPKPTGGGGPDWRGDRKAPRDATPRAGAGSVRPAAAPAPKRSKTWRVGELPPADRKRRKDDE